jgi:hypothetical protein
MKRFRPFGAALAVAIVFIAGSAPATTVSPNFSDLWWNPAESGWGVNVTQQADVLFATWFIYGPGNQPLWYAATLAMDPVAPDGTMTFRGDLVQTTGPWFAGGTFNPALVTRRVVGAAQFQSRAVSTATLTYTVDGVTVTKSIGRQTLRQDKLGGYYIGALSGTTYDCQQPYENGADASGAGELYVTHVGSTVTILSNDGCTFRAQYRQAGQLGYLDAGTFTCTGVDAVLPFAGYEISVEASGLLFRYAVTGPACSVRGNMAGARTN